MNDYKALPYPVEQPQKITVNLYQPLGEQIFNLYDIDNRCTISDIQTIIRRIKFNIWMRRIFSLLLCCGISIAGIIFVLEMPFKDSQKIIIAFFICFTIFGSYSTIRSLPMVSKGLFNSINNELFYKNLVFILPDNKLVKDKKKSDKASKNTFEIWRLESLIRKTHHLHASYEKLDSHLYKSNTTNLDHHDPHHHIDDHITSIYNSNNNNNNPNNDIHHLSSSSKVDIIRVDVLSVDHSPNNEEDVNMFKVNAPKKSKYFVKAKGKSSKDDHHDDDDNGHDDEENNNHENNKGNNALVDVKLNDSNPNS